MSEVEVTVECGFGGKGNWRVPASSDILQWHWGCPYKADVVQTRREEGGLWKKEASIQGTEPKPHLQCFLFCCVNFCYSGDFDLGDLKKFFCLCKKKSRI